MNMCVYCAISAGFAKNYGSVLCIYSGSDRKCLVVELVIRLRMSRGETVTRYSLFIQITEHYLAQD